MTNKHIVVCLSSHGFGHIGQTAPLIDELRKNVNNLRVTIRSSAPSFKLYERFGPEIHIENVRLDVGMCQQNALQVDLKNSEKAYADFHYEWEKKVLKEAKQLEAYKPDLVLSNIPYLSLASAKLAQIKSIAFGSINWAEIYAYYFSSTLSSKQILQQIQSSYDACDTFIAPIPHTNMKNVKKLHSILPIAQQGINKRRAIKQLLGIKAKDKIILVSLGGMNLSIDTRMWKNFHGFHFIVPLDWKETSENIHSIDKLDLSFIDVAYSCDAIICKPGYGTVVEAAYAKTPVLYLERINWPNINPIISWLQHYVCCVRVDVSSLQSSSLVINLNKVINDCNARKPLQAKGNCEASTIIAQFL